MCLFQPFLINILDLSLSGPADFQTIILPKGIHTSFPLFLGWDLIPLLWSNQLWKPVKIDEEFWKGKFQKGHEMHGFSSLLGNEQGFFSYSSASKLCICYGDMSCQFHGVYT